SSAARSAGAQPRRDRRRLMSAERPSSRAAAWWLAAIVLVAIGLRVYALGYGLPGVPNPDQIPTPNRPPALPNGSLHPHNFLYPTLYFYALFAWETLFFLVGRVFGIFRSVSDFQREFFLDPSRLVLAGRALTAVFGVVTIPAVYRFGARLYNRATGL